MDKPITMKIQDFREKMVAVMNESGLPWWKIQDDLQFFFLPKVAEASRNEELAEKEKYEKSLLDEEGKEE